MEFSLLDWIVVFICLSLFVGTGLYFGMHGRKKSANSVLQDFFLGGRNLPWFVAGLSMVATTFASDTPLAVSELIAQNGISGNWLWWSFLSGGLFTTFFFARLWRRADILTELEFITLRYGGKKALFLRRFKAVYLGFFMNILVIGWVNVAMLSLITTFFDLSSIAAIAVLVLIIVLALFYTAKSGLLGISVADSIQFLFAMSGCVILAIYVISSEELGSLAILRERLPEDYFRFFPAIGAADTVSSLTLPIGAFFAFIGVQWWASWYPGQEPGGGGYIAQRMMGTKDEKNALWATLFFQVAHYCIRPWPWIVVGLAAVAIYNPEFSAGSLAAERGAEYMENPRLGFVYTMMDFLPVGLKGFLFVAFLAAYMSTISTQLNWGASYLINDFLYSIYPSTNQNTVLKWARWITVFLAAIGIMITFVMNSISGVWEFVLECGAGLGLVLILRWFWWRINAWSEIVATVSPFVGYTIGRMWLSPWLGDTFTENKGTFLFTVLFTTISWLIVTFLTPAEDDKTLVKFYSRVRPAGFWGKLSNKNFGAFYPLTAWVFGIAAVYALLFFVGSILFGEIANAILYFSIAVGGGLVVVISINKGFSN